jgi:hypothetical protein
MFKQITNSSYEWRGVCPYFEIVNGIIRSRGSVFLRYIWRVHLGINVGTKQINFGYVFDSMSFFAFTYR